MKRCSSGRDSGWDYESKMKWWLVQNTITGNWLLFPGCTVAEARACAAASDPVGYAGKPKAVRQGSYAYGTQTAKRKPVGY